MGITIIVAVFIYMTLVLVRGDTSTSCRTICFHTNQVTERGAEVALYDYAHYAELMYCLKSVMLLPKIPPATQGVGLPKFKARFPIHYYNVEPASIKSGGAKMIEKAHLLNCSFIYIIKSGEKYSNPSDASTISISDIPIGIHAVFTWDQHGTTYAGISSDVTGRDHPNRAIVPHMVPPPNMDTVHQLQGLRSKLGIDPKALVLCRHGAQDSFNVKFVPGVIVGLLQKYGPTQLHFVFMNTNNFFATSLPPRRHPLKNGVPRHNNQVNSIVDYSSYSNHGQVHFLPGSTNQSIKEEFFRTCNAMIHARNIGESFGLAIGEFSVHNLPVITYANPHISLEHVRILGEKGFVYHNASELMQIVEKFVQDGIPVGDYNAYREFSPSNVMKQFVKVFLKPVLGVLAPLSTAMK